MSDLIDQRADVCRTMALGPQARDLLAQQHHLEPQALTVLE
jgi:hypothetical protein